MPFILSFEFQLLKSCSGFSSIIISFNDSRKRRRNIRLFHEVQFHKEAGNSPTVFGQRCVRHAIDDDLLVLAAIHNGLQDFPIGVVCSNLFTTELVESSVRSDYCTVLLNTAAKHSAKEQTANTGG